jgi:hypothetical protein
VAKQTDFIKRWLGHIEALSVGIGPRGSTTEGERRGSEYCEMVLGDLGLDPAMEPFLSARSIFLPHLLAAAAMLLSFVLYPLAGRWTAAAAAILAGVALASDLMELGFRDNFLRLIMPKAFSQNVVARVPPSGEARQDIILIGHVDTQRTPLVFRSDRWVGVYKAFTTIAFLAFLAQVILYVLGAVFQWPWTWLASIPSAACAVLLAAMCIEADGTEFTAGANDNASGAGLVLALAERLSAAPLAHSRVWLACTGCEEVQHYGAIDFFRRHKSEMRRPVAIAFELLGCAGPAWLTREGIVVPFRSSAELVTAAEKLALQHPEWGAYATQISGGNTEMTDALRVGIPAITLMGQTRAGVAPYWHMAGDTFDKMDAGVMRRAWAFVWGYLEALDGAA